MKVAYAELDGMTNFSFLEGASRAEELSAMTAVLGLHAYGVADRNTLAGVVRMLRAKKATGATFKVGCRLVFTDGAPLIVYPRDRAAYGRLCRLLSAGRKGAPKGQCWLTVEQAAELGEGLIALAPAEATEPAAMEARLRLWTRLWPDELYLAAAPLYRGDDRAWLNALVAVAGRVGAPLVAANAVRFHIPDRRPLADVLTCIREKVTISEAGWRLEANAERHLKTGEEMLRLFAGHEHAVARTVEIADRITFDLKELRYEYPDEPIPPGKTAQQHLEALTWRGAAFFFPAGLRPADEATIRKELRIIEKMDIAKYFLTVHSIVEFAHSRGILCQGRGSAANSIVCYCLGITAVNPQEVNLLFERFISEERREPPDIDVDFEHERREEVIQHIYQRYGRDRAAIAATVISYRPRSAIREVGKALGLTEDVTSALAGTVWGAWGDSIFDDHVRRAGLDPAEPRLRMALQLAHELIGFPRHLSQHVGGFVLTKGPLIDTVPVGNGAMKDRTFCEWDKDDLHELELMKVDVLALGMLTAIKKSFDMLERDYGRELTLASMPREDPAVYEMLCQADSLGVFQVESRAQMNMLPRLKPRKFYDLVVEVAIVRPGPIQGDMVHPYLRRRSGVEPVEYPSPGPPHHPDELKRVLEKTLGVPLFQEQAMRIAIEAAGFTPDEANQLRRAMATFRHVGTIGQLHAKLVDGMVGRGYDRDFAERCFKQIEGFGEYGFPESHAASFALLVYASSWIKLHHPEVFCAALLNSQPMGFYAPAQLVRDAREHQVEVRHPDVNLSGWDCTLEGRDEEWAQAFPIRKAVLPEAQPLSSRPEPAPAGGEPGPSRNRSSMPESAKRLSGIPLTSGQSIVQIPPLGVHCLDERVLPRSAPPLDPLLAKDRLTSVAMRLVPDQPVDPVLVREPAEHTDPVLFDPADQIACNTSVERPVLTVRQHVDEEGLRHPLWPPDQHLRCCPGGGQGSIRVPALRPASGGAPAGMTRVDADTLSSRTPPGLDPGGDPGPSRNLSSIPESAKRSSGIPAPPRRRHAVRLGFRQIDGFRQEWADTLVVERIAHGPYASIDDLRARARLPSAALDALAAADAAQSLDLTRRRALWAAKGLPAPKPAPLFEFAGLREGDGAPPDALPVAPLSDEVIQDYQMLRLSLKAHPLSFLRPLYDSLGAVTAADVARVRDGGACAVAGVVLVRQMPGSAKGVVFMTLEDETGVVNTVVWPSVFEANRPVAMGARVVLARGRIQRSDDVTHLVIDTLEDRSPDLARLSEARFDPPFARGDEVAHPLPAKGGGGGLHPKPPSPDSNRGAMRHGHPRDVRILPRSRDFH